MAMTEESSGKASGKASGTPKKKQRRIGWVWAFAFVLILSLGGWIGYKAAQQRAMFDVQSGEQALRRGKFRDALKAAHPRAAQVQAKALYCLGETKAALLLLDAADMAADAQAAILEGTWIDCEDG